MKLHANARLSPNGRRLLVDRLEEHGWDIRDAAAAAGISVRTARKWLARWRAEGESGLLDRSSAPKTVANKTDPKTVSLIAALRKLRFSGPEIAELTDRPLSTVSAVLKRLGMGRLGRLGLEPVVRYERSRPGELIHTDIKRLGRIVGGAGKHCSPDQAPALPNDRHRRRRRCSQGGWMGLRAHRHRRRHPAGLRRSSGRPTRRERRRVLDTRRGVLRAPRDHR